MALVKPEDMPEGEFANYFCTYGYLYHQKEMLEDRKRMQAYYDSIFLNKAQFHDKVVLDVGTGSGILAIWAAQAGARKVYAVEATHMAVHAKKLIEANGVGDRVEVLQGYMEKLELPEKVDIIISEWMGYFLLRESMLDSVLYARDKWLKPGGALYPSHCRMFVGAIRSNNGNKKYLDYQDAQGGWRNFCKDTTQGYGVDLSCLTEEYFKEQGQYYLQTSQWCDVHPNQVLAATVIKELDLSTLTVQDIKVLKENFVLKLDCPADPNTNEVKIDGLCGWFDVHFRGSAQNPAATDVELTTAPDAHGATHWGQQCFYLQPPSVVCSGDSLKGSMYMERNKENHRLMDVQFSFSHMRVQDGTEYASPPRVCRYHIE